MLSKETKQVVCYVRVSTENQLENYSIDEQIQRLKSYCQAKDWTLRKIYTDGGYSGGNINRPALQQLLQDIKINKPDAVVVYKLDRLSRSQKDTITLIEDQFLANDVDFISINENFDTTTPFGRAMIGILSVFAQLEKDQITERLTMGRIGRSKAGYFHGGSSIPTGYNYVDGELIVDDYKAQQVRQVFQSFLHGKSLNAIQKEMSAKYGGWSVTAVSYALKNSGYIGKVKFKGVEYDGRHQPIISLEDFQEVQRLISPQYRDLNRKSSAQKTPFRASYLLSSLITCQRCGAKYSANHGYYKCYSRAKSTARFVIDPSCKNNNWQIDYLDDYIIQSINDLMSNTKLMKKVLTKPAPAPILLDREPIEKRLKEIDKTISRMVDLYQLNTIPIEQIASRISVLDTEKSNLLHQIATSTTVDQDKQKRFLSNIAHFKSSFDSATLENKRLMVNNLIESILLDGDKITINWRV